MPSHTAATAPGNLGCSAALGMTKLSALSIHVHRTPLFRPLLDPAHKTWSGGVLRPRYVTPCRDVRRNVSSRRGTVCSMANTGKVQTQKGRGWGSMHPCRQSPSTHCTLSSQRWRWVGRDSRLAVCKLERCMGTQKHPALQTQPQRRGLQAVQHRPFDLRQQQCHAALGQAAL